MPQEVVDGFAIAGPMTAGGGSTPASTLWWDGWTVAKNVSDAEAEATFIAMTHAIRPEILADGDVATQAVWLIDGYKPTPAAVGVFAAAEANTIPYPMPLHGSAAHGSATSWPTSCRVKKVPSRRLQMLRQPIWPQPKKRVSSRKCPCGEG